MIVNNSLHRMLFALAALPSLTAAPLLAAASPRLEVVPVIFLPSDYGEMSSADQSRYVESTYRHLALAQRRWLDVLGTDTFAISPHAALYRGRHAHAHYNPVGNDEDGAQGLGRMLIELFEWKSDNRVESTSIYLILYGRPPGKPGPQIGGGRTFNGKPGSGGGAVQLELSSLLSDKPYPFQSTLVHELGHAFGLTHPNCYGYDINTNGSLMSYNLKHHTSGLSLGAESGSLNPEEYFEISQNRLAFPNFRYVESLHNPNRKPLAAIDSCYLGPMTRQIGVDEKRKLKGVGYELFHDGRLVSGPEAPFMSRAQAVANCEWNRNQRTGVKVLCRYNGLDLSP